MNNIGKRIKELRKKNDLTQEKLAALQAENSGLKAQISNDRQSAYLLNELKPCPIPAYITCSPYQTYANACGCNGFFA